MKRETELGPKLIRYEIQQDCAGCYRVIRTGLDGIRRAWDHPPCRSKAAARRVIQQSREQDQDRESM